MIQTPGAPFSPRYEDNSGLSRSAISYFKEGLIEGEEVIDISNYNIIYANYIVNECNTYIVTFNCPIPIYLNQIIQLSVWNNCGSQITVNHANGFSPDSRPLDNNRILQLHWKSLKTPSGNILFYDGYKEIITP